MRNLLKITMLMFAFAFILIGFDTASAQYRQNRREARREFRENKRDARRERRQTRRGYFTNLRYYTNRGLMGSGTRYYYYRGRLVRRW